MAPKPASTRILADYIRSGIWDEQGKPDHQFDDSTITVDLSGIGRESQALARLALRAWEAVANVTFNVTFEETDSDADITFDDARPSRATATVHMTTGGDITSVHLNVGAEWMSRYSTDPGSYGFQTLVHEIGHALGLGHSGPYEPGAVFEDAKYSTDSWQQTIMSYLDQDENPTVKAEKAYVVTPMMADIMAIQAMYGRPTEENDATAGNTRYGVRSDLGNYLDKFFRGTAGDLGQNAMTIYDRNGTDTIDFRDDTRAQNVNLGDGKFSSVYGVQGNLGIAVGTKIENFVAGSGSDRVAGNGSNNRIALNGGDDRANGLGGRDVIAGGTGSDQIWGGEGHDRVSGDNGKDRLWGGDGADSLYGGDGGDRLWGNSGNDTLNGGAGDDLLFGGKGRDVFVFGQGHDVVRDFEGADTLRLDDALWNGRDLSAREVIREFAHVTAGGDVLFDFDGGETLRVKDVTRALDLADDLVFF
ncbi:M10 family metallopeptidase C-terminal domain-containing protein [Rubellimicrobium arenae]|uniref:M10 family metallopeptidase C-terminal domain-containing protein n=1 Tax=Rubellimicrobium arenae TaxID=2817372 RepID=UPI001B313532|nr:M10 family metallopeptidase C-terminal domain-containing protein [Rubellimicrobium arenae]